LSHQRNAGVIEGGTPLPLSASLTMPTPQKLAMLGDMTDARKLLASMKDGVFRGIKHYIRSLILTTYVVFMV
jgi:hypothetical protein